MVTGIQYPWGDQFGKAGVVAYMHIQYNNMAN